MNMNLNTRCIIHDALTQINEKGRFTHIVLAEALNKYRYLPKCDRSFIMRTVLGTVERKITLDYIIDSYSVIKTHKMKPFIRNLLRMSVYQIVYMEGIKDFAVCNEAVKMASKRGFSQLKGFVNGILRTVSQNKDKIVFPGREEPLTYLSVKYSVPEWLVSELTAAYSYQQVQEIFKAQFTDRPLTVRCNTKRCTKAELAALLRSRKINVNSDLCIDNAIEISEYDYLEKIDEFEKGCFWVQDLSSMLAASVIPVKKGDYIIDVCAAPGGKSLCLADRLDNSGLVDSRDISEKKINLIRDNISRTGFENIKVKIWDAGICDSEVINLADAVIADVPCSGLGILNKKPDIKYHITEEKVSELVKLQRTILDTSSGYVKKGGYLCYSTCTVNPKENCENIEWFIKDHPFEIVDIGSSIPQNMRQFLNEKGMLQILPDAGNNQDGFFITLLKRIHD